MTSYNQIIIIIISLNHQGISFWSAESKESKGKAVAMNAPQHLCHRQQTPGGRPGAIEGLGPRATEGPKMRDGKKTQEVKSSHNYVYVYFFIDF